MRPLFLLTLAAALVAVPAAPALAQGKKPAGKVDPRLAEAKKLFDEGKEAYGQGNYEAAISAWERSYEISKKPLIFESIANAYERLGDPRKAREYLGKWRDAAPKDELELLDARIKNLDARIAHEEEEAARKEADEKASREKAEREKAEREKEAAEKARGVSVPGVALLGAGAGLVAIGVGLDIAASLTRPDAATACAPAGAGQLCKASAKGSIQSSNALAISGDALWITGAAAAVTGLVLVLVHKGAAPSSPRESATLVTPAVLPHGGGLFVERHF
jgi:tetratricopeptide (TPR) repeat protein